MTWRVNSEHEGRGLPAATGCGMKTLFLVRHAKSSRDDPALPDKDRPLNDRGKRDAPRWVSDWQSAM